LNRILQEVTLVKEGGSLGFSIIGGTDHSCMPFGTSESGIFISHVSTLCSGELKNIFVYQDSQLTIFQHQDFAIMRNMKLCLLEMPVVIAHSGTF